MPLSIFLIIAEKSIQNHSQADVNEIGVFLPIMRSPEY